MKRILALEFRRDMDMLIYCLFILVAFCELQFIFYDYDYVIENHRAPLSYELCSIALYAFTIIFGFLIPAIQSFAMDESKKISEHILMLPIKRWKVWVAKMIYILGVILVVTFIIFILPDPEYKVKEFMTKINGIIPKYFILYSLLAIILFFSAFSTSRYQQVELNKRLIGKGSLILSPALLIILVLSYMGEENISRYRLFVIAFFAGLAITLIAVMLVLYCRYRWDLKTIRRLTLVFFFSTFLVGVFQFSYSRAHLFSENAIERFHAFYMLLHLSENEAWESYRDYFKTEKYGYYVLDSMTRQLYDNPRKIEEMKDLWEWGIDNGNEIELLISIGFLAEMGENRPLLDKILGKLRTDEKFAEIFHRSSSLLFFCPPSERKSLILDLLESDNPKLRSMGYSLASLLPANAYLRPILETVKKDKETEFHKVKSAMAKLMLDHNLKDRIYKGKMRDLPLAEIEIIIEEWERWYSENQSRSFEERFNELLESKGYPTPFSKLNNEQLYDILKGEYHNEKKPRKPTKKAKKAKKRDLFIGKIVHFKLKLRLQTYYAYSTADFEKKIFENTINK